MPWTIKIWQNLLNCKKNKADSENSWTINVKDIDQNTFDLSAKNPNKKEETALRQPQEILEEMKALDKESKQILNSIMKIVWTMIFMIKWLPWKKRK